jgi:lysyl-tRNA synthetase class I
MYTLANAERGTVAIPCRECGKLHEAKLADFTEANDYTCSFVFSCGHKAVVRLAPEEGN